MFQLEVQPTGYDDLYNRLLFGDPTTGQKGIPDGSFYLKSKNIVPFTPLTTTFRLNTDILGIGVEIIVFRYGSKNYSDKTNDASRISIVPNANISAFQLRLGPGRNTIQARELLPNGRTTQLLVVATNYATFEQAYARETFVNSVLPIQDIERAIFNPYSTRLADMLITYSDLLPDLQALQIMGNRFAMSAFMHQSTTELGLNQLITGLTLGTPVIQRTRNIIDFEPIIYPLWNTQEDFAGVDVHVWVPNLAVAKWTAFIRLLNNLPQVYKLISVSEEAVVVQTVSGDIHTHRFDTTTLGLSSINYTYPAECFKFLIVRLKFYSETLFNLCAAEYTYDIFVTETFPIDDYQIHWDLGLQWDLGSPWDSDVVDPYTDGFIGNQMTGRFDWPPEHYLDCFILPSPLWAGTKCAYPYGFYTQMWNTSSSEIDADVVTFAQGNLYDTPSLITLVSIEIDVPPDQHDQWDLGYLLDMDAQWDIVDVALGDDIWLEAFGTFSDASVVDITHQVVWSTSNPAIATVTSGYDFIMPHAGHVVPVSVGTVTITATSGAVNMSVDINVIPAPVLISENVSPSNPIIVVGNTVNLIATGYYSDNTYHSDTSLGFWLSSNPSVATVGFSTGIVTAIAPGSANIIFSYNAILVNTPVTVI